MCTPGAGGVGLLLTQMATRIGARVITTVSTPAKAELSRGAGASDVILYTEQDFEVEVKRITGGKGVDVVYDSVGKTTFDQEPQLPQAPRPARTLRRLQRPGPALRPHPLASKGSLFITRPTFGITSPPAQNSNSAPAMSSAGPPAESSSYAPSTSIR